jgi:hypothetical protein
MWKEKAASSRLIVTMEGRRTYQPHSRMVYVGGEVECGGVGNMEFERAGLR